MRKLVIVMVMLGLRTATASASEMHMIVLTQDDTEIEVSVDKAEWQTETLDKGINYRTYQTSKATPTAEIMSYGDVIPLKTVQGRSGDWYCMARIARTGLTGDRTSPNQTWPSTSNLSLMIALCES